MEANTTRVVNMMGQPFVSYILTNLRKWIQASRHLGNLRSIPSRDDALIY